jgi:tetratricopeptide (TPR) repeat protein
MSPEQVEGKKVDHRSDIFSFGVVLYEMIAGRPPFHRDNLVAMVHDIVQEEPMLLSDCRTDITESLQGIVAKMLAKGRDDRYQTTGDLVEDLRRFQRGLDVLHASAEAKEKRPRVKSLAVLYLKNLGKKDDEFLSYGITEDLIVDLTRIGTIRVAPMRSIMRHKDSDDELDEIAKKLDVMMVLDGSIHKGENSVRVSAQLVDVVTGKNLWANRWEEPYESLPNVKQSLAHGISQALCVDSKVVDAAQVGAPEAQNPQAYEYYLRAKYTFEHKRDSLDVEVALDLYRQTLSLEPSLLAARAGIAQTLMEKNEYEQAEQELTSALADARRRGLRADEADILRLFSLFHQRQSHWDEALEYGERALEIRKELSDLAGEAEVLGSLMATLNKRSRFPEALEMSERILEINCQLDDQEKSAWGLRGMGLVYRNMGDYDRAMVLAEEALEIACKRGDNSLEAACTSDIGIIHEYTGNLDEALCYFEQALQIYTKLGNQNGSAHSINNIAVAHLSKGNYRKALEMFDKASMIHKEIGERSGYALTLCNIAVIQAVIGDYDLAIRAASQALVIAEELDYPNIITLANLNLGSAHFYKGEGDSAREYYLIALEVGNQAGLRRIITWSHAALSELHYEQEEYDLCREHSEKALVIAKEIGDKEYFLKVSIYLGALKIHEGQVKEGTALLREVSAEAKEYGDPMLILIALRLLGQALLEYVQNDAEREEGRLILEKALSLAKEKEVAYEVKWIGEILDQA